ncbi:hypothetical protein FAIPA1_550015 [Frankia sp. AiPs1]
MNALARWPWIPPQDTSDRYIHAIVFTIPGPVDAPWSPVRALPRHRGARRPQGRGTLGAR